jgi:hypothetical protein
MFIFRQILWRLRSNRTRRGNLLKSRSREKILLERDDESSSRVQPMRMTPQNPIAASEFRAQERSMTQSAKPAMRYSTLCAAIAVALCMISLPAVALVSAGMRPSILERDGLPQRPDNPWMSPIGTGLPIMTLRPIGSLLPLPAPAASHASRTPATIVREHQILPSLRRIRAHRVIYARFKIRPRLPIPYRATPVFFGGLY